MKVKQFFSKGLKIIFVVLTVSVLLFLGSVAIKKIQHSLLTENEKWIDDLEYLASVLKDMHADFELYADTAHFSNQVNKTRDLFLNESTSDIEKKVSFLKLVALLNDPHTRINNLSETFPNIFPYYILWFDDGPYLVLTTSEYKLFLGSKIIAFDNTKIEEVFGKLKMVVPHSNETGYKSDLAPYLRYSKLLHTLGISQNDSSVTLHLEKANGETDSLTLDAVNRNEWIETDDVISLRSNWDESSYPLFQQNREKNYWLTHLKNQNNLYVKYNLAVDDNEINGQDFWDYVLQFADSVRVNKLILDARGNGGGDNFFHLPLVEGIIERPWLNHPEKLFTIFDRNTFSAAITFVAHMEKKTNTTLVGEYVGDRPNTTGDVRYFTLPHSGMQVGIATIRWENTHAYDNRKSIEPDLYIGKYFRDYSTGRNTVIDSVLNYRNSNFFLGKTKFKNREKITTQKFQFSPFQEGSFTEFNEDIGFIDISGFATIEMVKTSENKYIGDKYNTTMSFSDSPVNYIIEMFDTTLSLNSKPNLSFDLLTELQNGNLLENQEKVSQLRNVDNSVHLLDRTQLNMLASQTAYYDGNEELAIDLMELNEILNPDDPFVYIHRAKFHSSKGENWESYLNYLNAGRKIFKRYFTVKHMNDHYLPF